MLPFVALALLAGLLAWANGSNDISKGIATLVGSGISNFRTAVLWGTAWTVAGGVVAAFASQGLIATFSGKGLLARQVEGAGFLTAVAIGAVAWVLIASRTGLPVSTTHAIAGAMAGAAILAQGAAALHWGAFTLKVVLPLGLSPLISILLIYAVFPLLSRATARVEAYCICLERRAVIAEPGAGGVVPMTAAAGPIVATQVECESSPAVAARLSAADGLHWLSSAATSFARGVNDIPKIVALGILAAATAGISGFPFYVAIALAMGAGSLVAGFRVTETLARRVTPMSPGEGFAANLVTTLLVGTASLFSLPVSTTHISTGAIIGIGLHREARVVCWRTVGDMLIAWLVTLPVCALIGAAAYALLR